MTDTDRCEEMLIGLMMQGKKGEMMSEVKKCCPKCGSEPAIIGDAWKCGSYLDFDGDGGYVVQGEICKLRARIQELESENTDIKHRAHCTRSKMQKWRKKCAQSREWIKRLDARIQELENELAAATRETRVIREALNGMAIANGAARGYDSQAVLKSIDDEIKRAEAVIKSQEEQGMYDGE